LEDQQDGQARISDPILPGVDGGSPHRRETRSGAGSGPLWTGACLAAKRARVQSGEGVIDAAPISIGGGDG
jgi:hypothetical protein